LLLAAKLFFKACMISIKGARGASGAAAIDYRRTKERLLESRMTFVMKLMQRDSPWPRRCIQANGNGNKSKSDAALPYRRRHRQLPVKKLTGS
jgi:hypothetical protein